MLFRIRTNLDLYYRLFFVGLFMVFGLAALGIVVMEDYLGMRIIPLASEIERQALLSVLGITGVLVIIMAFIVLFFMREKRRIERRRQTSTTGFPERRIIFTDRRNKSQQE